MARELGLCGPSKAWNIQSMDEVWRLKITTHPIWDSIQSHVNEGLMSWKIRPDARSLGEMSIKGVVLIKGGHKLTL